jgi:hypothetical protein
VKLSQVLSAGPGWNQVARGYISERAAGGEKEGRWSTERHLEGG